MRVRKLSATGGMTFGQGLGNFYINSAAGVGQEVVTRLKLIQGEWYLDTSQGVPWLTQMLGYSQQAVRDLLVKNTILTTPNVNILDYFKSVTNKATRQYSVTANIGTVYGPTTISTNLAI